MSTDQPNGYPGSDFFMRAWSDFATQMMRAGNAFTTGASPPEMTTQMRDTMLRSWGEYCDQFMRSPDFMQHMKQTMAATLEARKQTTEMLGRLQHEFQFATRQDVDQIMAALHHVERRVADRVDEISESMRTIESQLKDLEKKVAAISRSKKKSAKNDSENHS
jgi:hypothetical protein